MKAAERDSWTRYAEQLGTIRAQAPPERKPSKYRSIKVQVDGYAFDSKKEAQRWQELKYMQQAGHIADLERQPLFPLHVMCLYRSEPPIQIVTVGNMKADFRYLVLKGLNAGEIVVEDVKSEATKTTAYQLRKKIAEAVHGISITEV